MAPRSGQNGQNGQNGQMTFWPLLNPERTDMPKKAHTSDGEARPNESSADTVAAGQLRAFIERVERLEEEKKTIADDIRDVYAEMKGVGFDTKAVRTIIRWRKMDAAKRQEAAAMLELYAGALGMEGVFG